MSQIGITKSTTEIQVIQIYSAKNLLCHIELSEVGRGSFGTVLHAKHEILGDVAVKCITITGGERQQAALEKKLLKEYNKLQECRHPNVVAVFGVTKWPGAMGIMMEFCEGGNLRDLLLDDSIDVGLVLLLRMNLDIAAGVAYLHNCGLNVRVIHGDLKPENILLTVMLVCKITDLGSAQIASYTGSTTIELEKEKIALTLYYAAPEKLLHGARPKKEQDVYSCGVIQHMTLSREEPYQSQIEFQRKLEQGLRPNCEAIQELKEESSGNNREIVEVVEGAMVRCWDQDPPQRPNMITIRDEFQALMAKQDPAVVAQQVTVAVSGMNVQHPPQNPTVPLEQFSTEIRMFRSVGIVTDPQNAPSPVFPQGPAQQQGVRHQMESPLNVAAGTSKQLQEVSQIAARTYSSDATTPKRPGPQVAPSPSGRFASEVESSMTNQDSDDRHRLMENQKQQEKRREQIKLLEEQQQLLLQQEQQYRTQLQEQQQQLLLHEQQQYRRLQEQQQQQQQQNNNNNNNEDDCTNNLVIRWSSEEC